MTETNKNKNSKLELKRGNKQQFISQLNVGGKTYEYYPVGQFEGAEQLPISLKVLLENVVRNAGSAEVVREAAERVIEAGLQACQGEEVEFSPARVLFQDFTGVPVFVDFAVMREAAVTQGADPAKINPQVPCDLVIDHSVIANEYGCKGALQANMRFEFQRNAERYEFLKWAQQSFENVRIVPPGQGICHQLNIEKFANVVACEQSVDACGEPDAASAGDVGDNSDTASQAKTNNAVPLAYFDTLVGTDSHTPTANGIGVLGWGVGGIEAEAAALGQPITILVPRVIGVRLTGELRSGVSGMDVALTFANVLRERGVVGCFVECFGEGVQNLSATQRACISNMTPEYGCTCTLFPVDGATLDYLRVTGRDEEQVALVEAYAKAQGFWNEGDVDVVGAGAVEVGVTDEKIGDFARQTNKGKSESGAFDAQNPASNGCIYSELVEIDLSAVKPSIAGPSRPHDRILLSDAKARFREICAERGLVASVDVSSDNTNKCFNKSVTINIAGANYTLSHGALAIAAVTSCTTATDHAMMLTAGLLARNAQRAGLKPKPWVKTVFAPGSHATTLLLERAGLLDSMNALGFSNCGYGCMSCIGNSGPVRLKMHEVASDIELASVLSGNRNFEGRISPDVSQNYLCAPALVVAYSLVGTMDVDLEHDVLGMSADGKEMRLCDLMPDIEEVQQLVKKYVDASLYVQGSEGMFEGDEQWQSLGAGKGAHEGFAHADKTIGGGANTASATSTFDWNDSSTYVRRAPYFDGMGAQLEQPASPVISSQSAQLVHPAQQKQPAQSATTTKPAQPTSPAQIKDARVLAYLGDFITTDHISPAGAIAPDSPAAVYLRERGVSEQDFNTYGSRRGNHEVMMRGTFANVKLLNKLADGRRGGWTCDFLGGVRACENLQAREVALSGENGGASANASADTKGIATIFDTAEHYKRAGVQSIILAGKMYGSGSSRDWAAKGPQLLGVRAVIAESYERIHRSNLIGMGILPLQFLEGESAESLGLDGSETFTVEPIDFSAGKPCPEVVRVVAQRGACAQSASGAKTDRADGADGASEASANEVDVSGADASGIADGLDVRDGSDNASDALKVAVSDAEANDTNSGNPSTIEFKAKVRIDTPTEGKYYAHGGILQYVLRGLI